MKKLIMLIVVALACTVGGSAMASTASAATNCNAVTWHGIYYDSNWEWPVELTNCTDVDAVSFDVGDLVAPPGSGNNHWAVYGGGQIGGAATTYGTTYTFYTFGQGCGHPAFLVEKLIKFRLHNSVRHTWGSQATASTVQQIC